jgi:hypothetical protein
MVVRRGDTPGSFRFIKHPSCEKCTKFFSRYSAANFVRADAISPEAGTEEVDEAVKSKRPEGGGQHASVVPRVAIVQEDETSTEPTQKQKRKSKGGGKRARRKKRDEETKRLAKERDEREIGGSS